METNKVIRMESTRIFKRMESLGVILLLCMALLAGVVCYAVTHEARLTREAMTKAEQEAMMFDTSALEMWCKGEDIGTIRMMGGWFSHTAEDGVFVEDEDGNIWELDRGQYTINAEDFLLLWIADNHTPQVEDDVIVKVWNEVHT